MIFYPTLNSLKQKLNIPQNNTGKRFTNSYGMVFDNVERLHLIGTYENKAVFKSGTELTYFQYRGQNEDFGICKANLFRENDRNKLFLQICRTIAFENLLDKHPYIKFLKKIKINSQYIYINHTAIAQHYELQTPFLDLTSNFDVASFFATCKYDTSLKSFIPYNGSSKIGVIYVYNEMMDLIRQDTNIPNFEYIGWQGLPRPEEQKASIYKLNNNDNFSNIKFVKKYYFKHSVSSSKRIWKQFDKGSILFPKDTATMLADECKKLKSFTKYEINNAKERFKQWIDKDTTKKEFDIFIDNLKIDYINHHKLNWGELTEYKEEYWIDKFNKVYSKSSARLCYYPK